MIRLIATIGLLAAISACSPAAIGAPQTMALCEALRPDMPVSYDHTADSAQTVKGIRKANARYQAACG